MPFDGTDIDRTLDARSTIDAMLQFYYRPMTWTSGQMFLGDPRNPSVVCLRGALNFAVFGTAKPAKLRLFDPRQRVWRAVNQQMRQYAKQKYHRKSYMHANDHHFYSREDAIRFLMAVRQRLVG